MVRTSIWVFAQKPAAVSNWNKPSSSLRPPPMEATIANGSLPLFLTFPFNLIELEEYLTNLAKCCLGAITVADFSSPWSVIYCALPCLSMWPVHSFGGTSFWNLFCTKIQEEVLGHKPNFSVLLRGMIRYKISVFAFLEIFALKSGSSHSMWGGAKQYNPVKATENPIKPKKPVCAIFRSTFGELESFKMTFLFALLWLLDILLWIICLNNHFRYFARIFLCQTDP